MWRAAAACGAATHHGYSGGLALQAVRVFEQLAMLQSSGSIGPTSSPERVSGWAMTRDHHAGFVMLFFRSAI
jgi:hypothetical protein